MNTSYLSINQAMQAYDVSRSFLYQCKSTGKLKFYYILGKKKSFIKISEFEALMKPEPTRMVITRTIVDAK